MQNPYILILAGLPHLKSRLALNHNRPLAQRLIMRYQFQPLSKEDVGRYIQHHLIAADFAKMPIFSDAALEADALRSRQ
ncbi:hypothetical protein KHA80_07795 [Anaerobacillus sp. HL2]|nr:hypothetical protein KHA80_07795 [Anaerobacillus sp. HL2]